ncbi:hypothetical protein [Akkermansia sp.]|jgi:hypothetical protein|uniref:hypothetical protein n=1 Tax=Akkermansia sp. TaxID=1872421 RepID=UPI003FD72BD7
MSIVLFLLGFVADLESGKYEKETKAIGKSMNNKDRSTTLIKEPEASKNHYFQRIMNAIY